jgi:osmoprotectant transport system permease protein
MQPEFMYPAAASGDVDVISAYTSEGRIAQYDLVVLEDIKHVIPPYDAVILISPRDADDRALVDALRPLVGAIDVDLMRAANLRATSGPGDRSPDAVARWMADEIARRKGEKR